MAPWLLAALIHWHDCLDHHPAMPGFQSALTWLITTALLISTPLHTALTWLLENRVYIKKEKCEFHASRVSFLGFIIKRGQVQADPEKVRAVAEWPVPTSRKLLQFFLGFANFYRRFIWNYSQVVRSAHRFSPPQPMSSSGVPKQIMHSVSSNTSPLSLAPILAQPDPASPLCGRSGCVRCRSGGCSISETLGGGAKPSVCCGCRPR
ncbi:hypothetical protein L3Q82_010887 [Scortum barcoo]|uniref:Uncharacterized protein n=1 Tax=Scortum barcoo TaxID=214431 RepID=A0ACB8W7P2_9TELE|nr:hypothetical protein L3Q82_010887 [Scortum barcoo]